MDAGKTRTRRSTLARTPSSFCVSKPQMARQWSQTLSPPVTVQPPRARTGATSPRLRMTAWYGLSSSSPTDVPSHPQTTFCRSPTSFLFQMKYRLAHPENYFFALSKKNIFWIKVSKKMFLILKKCALCMTSCSLNHQWGQCLCEQRNSKLYLWNEGADMPAVAVRLAFICIKSMYSCPSLRRTPRAVTFCPANGGSG